MCARVHARARLQLANVKAESELENLAVRTVCLTRVHHSTSQDQIRHPQAFLCRSVSDIPYSTKSFSRDPVEGCMMAELLYDIHLHE